MEAILKHGSPIMVDHTPAGAVAAGQVLELGDLTAIAHRPIAANELGAVAIRGGVYEMPKTAGGATAIADRTKVYWDDAGNVITTTATDNPPVGYTVGASLDADTTQLVEHCPNV